ncbi:tRNA (adenosine(37)-N6)-threonylcarbamoyltransferase complex transferase subunit TsaD [Candidatus Odyssella acanthamoebae]|uniref:tRNA N6-adenosine threonylcarbamoyltransferase n=1 Tax=Candidatus Odyssella acanthamoebae TaxID=91604 RepID=A0A077AYM0_9PROT|nr:tRNA (adenosine(37)-N6)-threonylcarbamoyltransferase complex transferase subunit TsaD [Candidatus Paracaedibacter acanthamoebae]AIK97094.1 O-sialoglycoprotein endopeptidase [Candidatus Paracaedibacter acanthamoebae]
MRVLGIETSCDETAAAIVSSDRQILSNVIHAQIDDHQPYGGVVPEIAARNHLAYLQQVVEKSLTDAHMTLSEVDAIAVTAGPGLIGGVMVGVMAAKAMAAALNKPIIAVNHLEGHALTARLTDNVPFPFLLMLMSGGHCQILHVKDLGDYHLLGQTIDDAAGEAFDKVAKCLDLDYPGGPQIEKLALVGDKKRYQLPRPLKGRAGCDFSFAGLKTAARNLILSGAVVTEQDKADLCASFQAAVRDCLVNRLQHALAETPVEVSHVVLSGGVAANLYLREALTTVCLNYGKVFVAPPLKLCTDNAVMIAWAGLERLHRGLTSSLDFQPRPRWSLMELKNG